jgi:hypothetical protein
MATEKTVIIERIFDARWDSDSGRVTNSVVTLKDISEAIRLRNLEKPDKPLSDANPANFFKDFTRKRRTANANWPSTVFERGYTARQLTGGGQCFEFIRKASDQTEAFPLSVPMPSAETPIHRVTSAVLPVASREFGRADEPWLLQIIVRLRIVETHMTLFSPRRNSIIQVDHLQNSVKLHGSEIDAIFLGVETTGQGGTREFLITCEAKQQHEDFTLDQLLRQPLAAFKTKSVKQDVIVPIGIRTIGPSRIHLIEFAAVHRSEADSTDLLTRVSDSIYQLEPPVPGIGKYV